MKRFGGKTEKTKLFRCIFACSLVVGFFVGQVMAQDDRAYVIKMSNQSHYLARTGSGTTWSIADATSFNPNCIWLSGNNYNYYFDDGVNQRYLSAPLELNGVISLSSTYPGTQVLSNITLNYFFYDWDNGLARGLQHSGGTCPDDYNSPGSECWQAVWVSYENSNWQMSSVYGYSATPNAAHFYAVTVTEHEKQITSETGGISGLSDFAMNFESPLPASYQIIPSYGNYSYTYIPEYTTYYFDGATHNYYDAGTGAADQGSNTPGEISVSGKTPSSYMWTISGEGAEYLAFSDNNIDVKTSTSDKPTLYYLQNNTQGHKEATLTVTVTYNDGSTQTRTATVTVKTNCQNPAQSAEPVVDYEGVTVSWYRTSDSYKVYWQKVGAVSWNDATVGDVSSYTFTGLEDDAAYKYKVVAICSGSGEQSNPTEYTFTTKKTPGVLVYGAVFGGGRMADVTGKTEVVIINCDSLSAVYGGNDIAGEVKGADGATITLGVNSGDANDYDDYGTTGAVVKIGSVYGGGNGYYAYDGASFAAASYNTTYTVANNVSVRAMTRLHKVGETVWTNETGSPQTLKCPKITKTSITVTNDYVKVDSLFGGAKNAILSDTTSDVSITVDGGTVFSLFGGNNFGGSLGNKSNEYMVVNKTKIDPNLALNVANSSNGGFGRDFGIRYLFGGGNKVAGCNVQITVNGGQIDTLFGGGNSADVISTNVNVSCSLATGSDGKTFGKTYSYAISSFSDGNITPKDDYSWDGTGIYNVRTLFGGNNAAPMEGLPNVTLNSGSVGTVYGGGNAGDMLAQATDNGSSGTLTINDESVKYSTHVVLNSGSMIVDNLYGGCQMSNVHYSTWVEVKNGHVGTVYGGCNVSGDVGSTCLNLNAAQFVSEGVPNENYQKVYGGTYVEATGGVVYKNIFAGSNGYYHCSSTSGQYVAGLNYGDEAQRYIGLYLPTHNETHVLVKNGATIKGNVYAGGNLACVGFDNGTVGINPYPKFVGLSSVRMSGGEVFGDVYGGGNMADVYGSSETQVSGGIIHGSLYGGNDRTGKVAQISNRVLPASYNTASDGATSLLDPKIYTYVSVSGNPKIGTVYGGGNGDYAYFTSFEQAAASSESKEKVVSCSMDNQPIQRCTFVDIGIDGGNDGGYIGAVYGGGDGVTVTEHLTVFFNVQNAGASDSVHVGTIFGGNNQGALALVPKIILFNGKVRDVYGGCNQGDATGSTSVTAGGTTYTNVGSYVHLLGSYKATEESQAVTPAAVVTGSVYGGCRASNVTNNSMVIVEGTNSSSADIFGGNNISGSVGGTSRVIVSGGTVNNVYAAGNLATYTAPSDVNNDPWVEVKGGTVNGNVYGAGKGDRNITSSGEVTGNPWVKVTGGTVVGNVFGGGDVADVIALNLIEGNTKVEINGGTIGERVFGGGNAASISGTAHVFLNAGSVAGGVYGGCNSEGAVTNSEVTLTGGSVGTSLAPAHVHGGGYGASTDVSGNVIVNMGSITNTDETNKNITTSGAATVYGDVYGGSALGDVNTGTTNTTTVNLFAGTVEGNVFGGGLGDGTHAASVNGNVFVNVNGKYESSTNYPVKDDVKGCVVKGDVFGCNNLNGSPKGTVTVHVFATQHVDKNNVITKYDTALHNYDLHAVYGGGSQAAYQPTNSNTPTNVIIDGCGLTHIQYVYGGGNAASVPASDVTVNASYYIENVFGGGNGKDQINVNGNLVDNPGADIGLPESIYGAPGNTPSNDKIGTATVTVFGGTIVNVFGGSNTKGDVVKEARVVLGDEDLSVCDFNVANVYGGSNEAYMSGTARLYMNCFKGMKSIYGGSRKADVNHDIVLNINSGKYEKVFGGNNLGGCVNGSITINIEQTGCLPIEIGELYGGGNQANYSVYGYDVNKNVIESGNKIHNDPVINIVSCKHIGSVFGGGLNAKMVGDPHIYINMVKGWVDGAYENSDISDPNKTYETAQNMSDLGTIGDVYGGGKEAQVTGNTYVYIGEEKTVTVHNVNKYIYNNILSGIRSDIATDPSYGTGADTTKNISFNSEGAIITGNVFGGGLAGAVTGTTNVSIQKNANIGKNVYGGGQQGEVGNTKVIIGKND